MGEEILVVYKKNFEEVHDRSLEEVRSVMDALVAERGANVGYTARETVRRADFSGPDLVIVLGGGRDAHLDSPLDRRQDPRHGSQQPPQGR